MGATIAQPAGWVEHAPIVAEATVEIAAPPERVWAVIADHERWPAWFPGVSRVEITGGDGIGLDATRRVTLRGGTRFDERIIIWEPGHAFGFTVVAMRPRVFRSLNERVTLDDLGDGRTRVTYRQGFDTSRWFAPVLQRLARKRLPASLQAGLAGLARQVGDR